MGTQSLGKPHRQAIEPASLLRGQDVRPGVHAGLYLWVICAQERRPAGSRDRRVLWRGAGSSWVVNTRHRAVTGLFLSEFLHNGVHRWLHVDWLCGHRLPWGFTLHQRVPSVGRYCGPASRALVRSQLCTQLLTLAFVSAIVPLGRHAITSSPPPRPC